VRICPLPSSNLPCFSTRRPVRFNSSRIASSAGRSFPTWSRIACPGKSVTACSDSSSRPVSGSNRVSRSISSPKNSTAARPHARPGEAPPCPPRTRNSPRVNSMSLREYCKSPAAARKCSRVISIPTRTRDDHRLVILFAADTVNARKHWQPHHIAPGKTTSSSLIIATARFRHSRSNPSQ